MPSYLALDDTVTLSGSEAYQDALVFNNSVKAPHAGSIFDDLSTGFPGRGPAKKV